MIKKTITYTDYNGLERTEDFYFNFSKAEIAEMQLTAEGGMDERIKKIVSTVDTPELIRLFKRLVMESYGEKSPDGRRFIKSKELATAFTQTEAYSQLFMELASNAEMASEFTNGIMPKPDPEELAKLAEAEAEAERENNVVELATANPEPAKVDTSASLLSTITPTT